MTLKQEVASGALWSGASQAIRQAIQIGVTILFLHLLVPDEYGLIRLALVFTSFLGIFREFGLSAAVIHKQAMNQEQLSTIFWFNVATGAVLALVTVAAAPFLAWFFREPRLLAVTIVLSVLFIWGALEIVQRAVLRKQMDFRTIAVVEVEATLLASAAGVVVAVVYRNVWALVCQQVLLAALTSLGFFFWSRWKPSWQYRWSSIREVLGFSLHAFGSQVLGYFARNLDTILIGRLLGVTEAGLYGAAYTLMMMPVRNISWTLGNVTFPAYARLQNDLPRMRSAYLRSVQSIALLAFPMMLGMAVLARPLMELAAREEYAMTARLIGILAVVGMVQAVGTTVGSVCLSQGRADRLLQLGLVAVPVIAVCLVAGTPWGLTGVAVGYTVSQILLWLFSHWMANSLIGLSMRTFLEALAPLAGISLLMGAGVYGLRLGMENAGVAHPGWLTGVPTVAGVGVYWGFLRLFRVRIVNELLEMIHQARRRGQTAENGPAES